MSSSKSNSADAVVSSSKPTSVIDVPLEQMTHLVGFDWATRRHQVVVVDRLGKVVLNLCFEDDQAGWALLREKLSPMIPLAVAVETCNGPAVERLLEMGLAVTQAKQLRVLQTQLDEYRRRIGEAFGNHPDSGLFGSLPGAAEKLAPRLLAELGADRGQFDDAQALQCYAGTAPVTRQSGKKRVVKIRFMCNTFLRHSMHLWANASREKCAWAQAYCQQKKEQGLGHAAALRCLGQRWLKILWKMWQTHARYDAELHQRNQLKHGSWVLALQPKPA
jgi:transposase